MLTGKHVSRFACWLTLWAARNVAVLPAGWLVAWLAGCLAGLSDCRAARLRASGANGCEFGERRESLAEWPSGLLVIML